MFQGGTNELTDKFQDPTFVVNAVDVQIANNKSMISLLNNSGSTVIIRLRQIKIINSRVTPLTGVTSDFRLYRITGHSSGTLLTSLPHDTNDSINGSVTARTGATLSGTAANHLYRWQWSSDEWGTGTLDQEGYDHGLQNLLSAYKQLDSSKPIILRAGEGITINHVFNSTNGTFDLSLVFTQDEL